MSTFTVSCGSMRPVCVYQAVVPSDIFLEGGQIVYSKQ